VSFFVRTLVRHAKKWLYRIRKPSSSGNVATSWATISFNSDETTINETINAIDVRVGC
jgi:hypothetical protein